MGCFLRTTPKGPQACAWTNIYWHTHKQACTHTHTQKEWSLCVSHKCAAGPVRSGKESVHLANRNKKQSSVHLTHNSTNSAHLTHNSTNSAHLTHNSTKSVISEDGGKVQAQEGYVTVSLGTKNRAWNTQVTEGPMKTISIPLEFCS